MLRKHLDSCTLIQQALKNRKLPVIINRNHSLFENKKHAGELFFIPGVENLCRLPVRYRQRAIILTPGKVSLSGISVLLQQGISREY